MTRKDFKVIAKILAQNEPLMQENAKASREHILWDVIVRDFAYELEELNPKFNCKTFFQACGLETD